ncbi:MAG: peptidoglycan-binding domain-containing protein [Planctomycetota bacterium]|nr:peptidoglycan-binding domain-containing protein [Planctomycetota bacterium]
MQMISQPVGRGVANTNRADVRLIQQLLNQHRKPPLRMLMETGVIDAETIAAIEEFQKRVVMMSVPDGRVDPGGATLRALSNPPTTAGPTARPHSIDALIALVQGEFPDAGIRITGRGRTIRRQAELMAQRRLVNQQQFLSTYRHAPHITEMDTWVTQHPQATESQTIAEFEQIITRARQNGATVSNHLSDTARDISIPLGGHTVQSTIRRRIEELGGRVIDERDAVGGPHWHVDR